MNRIENKPKSLNGKYPSKWSMETTVGLILFVAVFLFYVVKAPAFSVPGRWAGIVANFSGLDPFRHFMRPIWSTLVWLVSTLPIGNMGLAINIISALIGAGVCWLLYDMVRRIPFARAYKRSNQASLERMPRLFAGISAGIYAAVMQQMMIVSTRGDYKVFDIFLMLLAFYPFLLFIQVPRTSCLYLSFLLFGLGLAEYPVMVTILPGFLVWWGYTLWKKKAWPKTAVLFMAVALMFAGLMVVFVYSGIMSGSNGAVFRGINGSGAILGKFYEVYFLELIRSVPRVGWLLICGMNILPFLFVMFRETEEPSDGYTAVGVYPLRLVLLAIGLVTLFNLPGSPAHIIGSDFLLLAPGIMTAIWFGYLIGYYYGLISKMNILFLRYGYIVLWVGVFLFAGYRHAVETRVGQLMPVVQFVEDVVTSLDGRNYLVTDGMMDDSLRLAARKTNVRIRLINIGDKSKAQGRYHASLFASPTMRNAARIGPVPLLNDWLARDPDVAEQIAFLTAPDIVEAHGYAALPNRTTYRIIKKENVPELGELFNQHRQYWETTRMPTEGDLEPGRNGWFHTVRTMRWLSRIANDLGVLLEDQGANERAVESYNEGLTIWPDNMSATLNLLSIARQKNEEAEQWEALLQEQIKHNQGQFNIYFLTQVSGRLRDASALLEEAVLLVTTGHEKLAAERTMRAASRISDHNLAQQLSLARLYLHGNETGESEKIFQRMLENDPDSSEGLSGMMRVAILRGQYEEAARLLERLETLGLDSSTVQLEDACLKAEQGKYEEAKAQLLVLTQQSSPPLDAWYVLGLIALVQNDEELFKRVSPNLESSHNYMPGILLLGEWAMRKTEYEKARGYFEQTLMLVPSNTKALEKMIMLDYVDRNADALRNRSATLLSINPEHPLGHFGAANVHIAARQFDLAEISLRRCLESGSFGPAHNDLAWILNEAGNANEAHHHALKACEALPEDPNVWDTLAAILLNQEKKDEAVLAIEKALELGGNRSAGILLHAGEIYLKEKNLEKTSQVVVQLEDMKYLLSPELVKRLGDLSARLQQ